MKADSILVHSKQAVARYQGQLRFERLNLLHRTLPIVLAANLINASLIVAVFSDRTAPPLLIGWWLLMLAMVAVRGAGWFCYRNRSATQQMHERWETFSILGSGASGILWGAAGFLFCVPDELYLVVLGFVIGGMGAGALASLDSSHLDVLCLLRSLGPAVHR